MRVDVVTLFPEMFSGYLGQSLLKKALDVGLVDVQLHNLRDWAEGKHHQVDDRPFGGGPGMVIKVEPTVTAVEAVREEQEQPGRVILLSPSGRRLDQPLVEELSGESRLILLCGRYEGFDQRTIDILQPDEVSIGDFVLNGGEVAAMVLIDAVVRLVPGVLGDKQSSVDDSFSSGNRLLEAAQYTRPREFRGYVVPEILLSGDHGAIAQWRKEQSYLKTKNRRADLLNRVPDECDSAAPNDSETRSATSTQETPAAPPNSGAKNKALRDKTLRETDRASRNRAT